METVEKPTENDESSLVFEEGEPMVVEEIDIEELAIDGICGVY